MEVISGGITAPDGFYSSGVHCGLRRNKSKKDLALIYSDVICNGAAVYTQNQVKGEPLVVTKNHLEDGKAQAIIINSGNANTCTGDDGYSKAVKMTELTAQKLGIKSDDVLVASTGVIGVPLNLDAIESGLDRLVEDLSKDGHKNAATAIHTTDTITKEIAVSIKLGDYTIKIGAMAKGSGMVHPNMGTMLAFITTNLNINQNLLQEALTDSVNKTYNRISLDGDVSTNDMAIIISNGKAQNPVICEKSSDYYAFLEALNYINIYLTKLIAKDGEGATKLIECTVQNAVSEADAVALAKSVIQSNLVKSACFGADANWGRILCALGYSNVPIDVKNTDVAFESKNGYFEVCKSGVSIPFDPLKAKSVLNESEIKIIVNLNMGKESATAWGCDLSYDFVRLNGDYANKVGIKNVKNMGKADILMQALPYIQKYFGKTILVKYGGNAMVSQDLTEAVINDLILMNCIGINVVLVHGGGPEINSMLEKTGKESVFINGLRYTDEDTISIVQMVLAGKVNKDLVSLINRNGGKSIGICGIDGNMLMAKKLKKGGIDLGYVGEIEKVNTDIITNAIKCGYIPVIGTVASGEDGSVYNINGDTAAAKIAAALNAEKLIILTNVPGVLKDPSDKSSLLTELKIDQAVSLIEQGIISGGMIPKINCCIDAVKSGVNKAHIIDGRVPHSIILELLSDEGIGTMIG